MQYALDDETARYCLESLQLGEFGPNGLHYRILHLMEELNIDGVIELENSILQHWMMLPDEIYDQGDMLDEESDFDPLFIRLHNIATARRALHVAQFTLNEPGLDPVVWSAIATVKGILETYNDPEAEYSYISPQEIGLMEGELTIYPDPGIRVEGGWGLWCQWLEMQDDEWASQAENN